MGVDETTATTPTTTVYDNVKFKKLVGTLTLNNSSDGNGSAGAAAAMTFTPSSSSSTSQTPSEKNSNISPIQLVQSWKIVSKHQVSPASHPKAMLKINLVSDAAATNGTKSNGSPSLPPSSLTFQFMSGRSELEKIRKDISDRLQQIRGGSGGGGSGSDSASASTIGTKRPHPDSSSSTKTIATTTRTTAVPSSSSKLYEQRLGGRPTSEMSFDELDPTALAVVRSSLLASNPNLRSQHQYLVQESKTLDEDDFWKTHQDLLEEEYARISGIARAGTSSLLKSHVQVSADGKLSLGVEEMRQIFIMHPAVHKAYEEKVPLELSDEQFWRKYLESEYFHLDRGKIGAASRGSQNNGGSSGAKKSMMGGGSSDDMFSRYHQKLREAKQSSTDNANSNNGNNGAPNSTASDYGDQYGGGGSGGGGGGMAALAASTFGTNGRGVKSGRKWGTKLAVGQFDLASTFATERGDLLEGPKDNHPLDDDNETNGMKVIQKYNRHWAMVLNPEDAVAGSNLLDVARQSVNDTIPDDEDAKPGGGLDDEMQRLVGFANASSDNANHALGIGESDEYQTLTLKNVDVYNGGGGGGTSSSSSNNNSAGGNKSFAARLLTKMNKLMGGGPPHTLVDKTKIMFPDQKDDAGKMLLLQLTKKMDKDSRTEADTLDIVNALPEDFKKRLHSYFRRSSELLRHFFGLRRLMDSAGPGSQEMRMYQSKLAKIKNGMETVHTELYDMRQKIEGSSKEFITMRRMCDQILDQLGHAFNLATDATNSGGGGGGFEVVDILGN
eukprot:CAMPEP_0113461932 /NCGR_PEP_ID=MMETSP0014_2-20120614/11807_1 /TAXON_ID=2857 /ORGANISM="Nitzschia sp." /LENGTH=780 /DNA_ID=CAMNT_0000353731 /DNA_START=111 /DNA_END=2453 /DNA_ORIENTATION=+ /assembly_acc=CAM_ASM_000159